MSILNYQVQYIYLLHQTLYIKKVSSVHVLYNKYDQIFFSVFQPRVKWRAKKPGFYAHTVGGWNLLPSQLQGGCFPILLPPITTLRTNFALAVIRRVHSIRKRKSSWLSSAPYDMLQISRNDRPTHTCAAHCPSTVDGRNAIPMRTKAQIGVSSVPVSFSCICCIKYGRYGHSLRWRWVLIWDENNSSKMEEHAWHCGRGEGIFSVYWKVEESRRTWENLEVDG